MEDVAPAAQAAAQPVQLPDTKVANKNFQDKVGSRGQRTDESISAPKELENPV